MALVFSKDGDKKLLQYVSDEANHYTVKLFQNDVTPNVDSVEADFTEADFDGYALQAAFFSPPFINGNDKGQVTAAMLLWIATGDSTPNDIYGVYVTQGDMAAGTIVYAERFPAPVSVVNIGDFVAYQPSITCVTE